MVKSQTTSITPAQHAANHVIGGTDPLIDPLFLHAARHEAGGADVINMDFIVTDVTLTHNTLADIHRNTSGETQLHFVRMAGGAGDTWRAEVENATPPAITVDMHVCPANAHTMIFVVEDDDYYEVSSTDGTNTIDSWIILNL
jgi:hypothetical protein